MTGSTSTLYILARRDLPCSQRAVQACHALANLMARHSNDNHLFEWALGSGAIVMLGVKDEDHLDYWERELLYGGIVCEHFAEPDMRGEKTALAVHPMANEDLFRKLQLL